MGSALDRCFQKRTGNCLFDCLKRLVVSASGSDTDMSDTLVFHNSLYIRKVEVDQRRYIDQVCNTLDTLLEHFVSFLQSFRHRCPSVYYFQKFIIRNYDQCVHILF